jgi:hypothetical protein
MVSPIKVRLISLLVIVYSLFIISGFSQQPRYVRVAIMQDAASLRLKIGGAYEVIDSASNELS